MKLVLIEVKAEISVNTTDKEFLAFLNDTQQMTSWFDNTQQIKQSTSSKGDAIIMFQFKSVFISKRRQMVVKYKTIKLNADKTLITIIDQGEQLDPTLLFLNTTLMNVHKAHWLIENTTDDNTNDKINVTYQFVIDPKSRFPMWLANKYLLKSTLNTLQNINAKFSGVLDKPH